MQEFVTKLGTTRAGPRTRIWIEGKRLDAHGFLKGRRILKTWITDGLILTIPVDQSATGVSYATVSGKGPKPIIDVSGKKVNDVFGGYSHVKVFYDHERIMVRPQLTNY